MTKTPNSPKTPPPSPTGLPSAGAMLERDRASAMLGIRAIRTDPGHAIVEMLVRADMLNGFDVVHGGLIFSLADTAFAISCNEDERVTLAAGADITFLAPVRLGTTLTATALRRARTGRSGLYDVTVTDHNGLVVAEFRGRSRSTSLPRPTITEGSAS